VTVDDSVHGRQPMPIMKWWLLDNEVLYSNDDQQKPLTIGY